MIPIKYNVRNLVTLEALSRTRSAVAGAAPDGALSPPSGNGRPADPYVVAATFVDLNDARNRDNASSSYSCNGRPQQGGEVVYQLELTAPSTIDCGGVPCGT